MPAHQKAGRFERQLAAGLVCLLISSASVADVVLDGSLGPAGPLTGPDFAIDATVGKTVGTNLFHSFSEFNLTSSQSATFTNSTPATISNVLARITDVNASSIDGRLASTIPGANLFLMNPNGIVFGPNATLDVQGAFHATTADYIGLADGTRFSAAPSTGDALLTTVAPAAFGFLGNRTATLAVDGSALQVPLGETLSLVGGEVQVVGGLASAPGGALNLVGVQEGEAGFNGAAVETGAGARLGSINVIQSTLVTADGNSGGAIYIHGGNIVVDNSLVFATTDGAGNPGVVDIRASESVNIENGSWIDSSSYAAGDGGTINLTAATFNLSGGSEIDSDAFGSGAAGGVNIAAQEAALDQSYILAYTTGPGDGGDVTFNGKRFSLSNGGQIDVSTVGSGDAGNITVNAEHLELRDGAGIASNTFGPGRGGDLTVNAQSVVLAGQAGIHTLFAVDAVGDAPGSGDGGHLTVNAESLELSDGALIVGDTFGPGNGGDLTINAQSLVLQGPARSSISVQTQGTGHGGHLVVNAESMEMRDGAQIGASTFGPGRGGDVTINAQSLVLAGGIGISPTAIANNSQGVLPGSGDAGNITVSAERLEVSGGAQIASGTFGPGRGGDLTINAQTGLLEGWGDYTPSGFVVATVGSAPGSGDAGNLVVNVDQLELRDGAQIGAGTLGPGRGSDLTVNAQSIVLTGQNQGIPTAFTVSAEGDVPGSGDAGNLIVNTSRLEVRDGAQIGAGTFGPGRGGDLTVNAQTIILEGAVGNAGSGLFGNSQGTLPGSGDAGNITVNAEHIELRDGAGIASNTFGPGRGGDLIVNAQSILLEGQGQQIASAFSVNTAGTGPGSGNAGNLIVTADQLTMRDGAQISASTFGPGRGGDVAIEAHDMVLEGGAGNFLTGLYVSSLGTAPGSGDAGDLGVTTEGLLLRGGAQLDTATFGPGHGGNLTVNAESIVLDGQGKGVPSRFRVTADGTDPGAGDAGSIMVSADSVQVSNGAAITGRTSGPGAGGNISISATSINLVNGGSISSESESDNPDAGKSGNISISARDSLRLQNGGSVSVETARSDAGDISIAANSLVYLLNGSKVSTSVANGQGSGGDITIDPQFVVLNNSQITANAFAGAGGNIRITAENFFISADSTVSASSTQSVAGTVVVESPENDIAGSISQLPQSFLDTSALLPGGCNARRAGGQSSFTVAGRGGVAIDPDGYLPSFHAVGTPHGAPSAATAAVAGNVLENTGLVLVSRGCR
jgi:filamentous hemagglutinin family protein